MESVPLLDLKAQYADLRGDVERAVTELMASQQFVLGKPVQELESQIAAYTGSPHAVGCASGTDALILALASLGLGPGDSVVTSPFSFFSTASCAYKVGARPRFADIDPLTFNLCPEAAEAAIDSTTRALMPVHLFGQCADMDRFRALASKLSLSLVEDAAQALGAEHLSADGTRRHAGSLSDVGCYSFFPTKNLGAFGDGGMMVAPDAQVAERLGLLRVHGGKQMYHHEFVGWNSRLDALQAVVLSIKLPHLDGWSEGRRQNAERYDRWLTESGLVDSGAVQLPARADYSTHIFNQYVVRVSNRDALREHLNARQVGHSVYYPVPLHLQECFADLGYKKGDFPIAEQACEEVLALPIFPELGAKKQERVVDALLNFNR